MRVRVTVTVRIRSRQVMSLLNGSNDASGSSASQPPTNGSSAWWDGVRALRRALELFPSEFPSEFAGDSGGARQATRGGNLVVALRFVLTGEPLSALPPVSPGEIGGGIGAVGPARREAGRTAILCLRLFPMEGVRLKVYPKPFTASPNLCTLNPEPQTLNHKP